MSDDAGDFPAERAVVEDGILDAFYFEERDSLVVLTAAGSAVHLRPSSTSPDKLEPDGQFKLGIGQ
jgi:hypothetical protein